MYFLCTITPLATASFLPKDAADRFATDLAVRGWAPSGDGAYRLTLPADPNAVDAPAIRLGTMLRDLMAACPESGAEAAVTITFRYREHEIFSDALRVRIAEDGRAGLCADAAHPPFFSDLIRLRDKMIATLQKVHRKK